jgi:hypothetical protein
LVDWKHGRKQLGRVNIDSIPESELVADTDESVLCLLLGKILEVGMKTDSGTGIGLLMAERAALSTIELKGNLSGDDVLIACHSAESAVREDERDMSLVGLRKGPELPLEDLHDILEVRRGLKLVGRVGQRHEAGAGPLDWNVRLGGRGGKRAWACWSVGSSKVGVRRVFFYKTADALVDHGTGWEHWIGLNDMSLFQNCHVKVQKEGTDKKVR